MLEALLCKNTLKKNIFIKNTSIKSSVKSTFIIIKIFILTRKINGFKINLNFKI